MKILIVLTALLLLSGCVIIKQKPIQMPKNFLQTGQKKIGIFAVVAKPDVHLPGASCLLCIAVAEAAHSELSTHVDTFTTDEILTVTQQLADKLKKKGIKVTVINDVINQEEMLDFDPQKEGFALKDYRNFANKYKVSHLIKVQINLVGVQRHYSSYVPVAKPTAIISGSVSMVDLKDNSYKWYKPVEVLKNANGNWDEPPTFPALTNSYYQAIESSREVILGEI